MDVMFVLMFVLGTNSDLSIECEIWGLKKKKEIMRSSGYILNGSTLSPKSPEGHVSPGPLLASVLQRPLNTNLDTIHLILQLI